MTSLELDTLNKQELLKLQKDIKKAIETAEVREKQKALHAAEAAAQEFGYTLDDVLAVRAARTKSKYPPKYQHPDDPEMTWSGRGRQPYWIKDALEKGSSLDDFAIPLAS